MRHGIRDIGSWEPDKLIAGNLHPIDNSAVVLTTGDGVILKRGTLLNRYGNIYSSSDETPVGILCDDVELNATTTTDSLMYIGGDFKASEIIVGSDINIWDLELELRKLGIFIK